MTLRKATKCYLCKGPMAVGDKFSWHERRIMRPSRKYGAIHDKRAVPVHYSQADCDRVMAGLEKAQ